MTELNNSLFPDFKVQKQRTRRLQFILLAVAALLAVGIIIISINSYKNFEFETRSNLEQQLDSIGELKSSEISTWFRERHGDAEVLKNSPGLPSILHDYIENPADIYVKEILNEFMLTIIREYRYESLILTDPNGQVLSIFSSVEEELKSLPRHAQSVVTRAINTGEIEFLDLHRHAGEESQRIYFSFIVPFYEESSTNKPLAAIVMTINPDSFLYPLITSWPVPSGTAETLLVKLDGEDVLFLNPLRFKPDAALNLRIPLDQSEILAVKGLTGQEGIVEGFDYRGQRVIGTIHKVAGSDWVMVSKIDYAEFIAPIQARRERAIFTTTALLLIAFAILFIVWRSQQLRYLKAVGTINEELERRVMERTAQLETAKKELEAFAYSVSHDLRAPLRAMSGFGKLLEEEYRPQLGETGQHYIDRIQAASSRMGELIEDLLTLSRVTRSEFTYTQVDLSKLALETFTALKETHPDLQVDVRIDEGLTARGDQKLLAIAMDNLLNNAWKFSSHEPQIIIDVGSDSNDKNQKTFYIRDNGSGFKMDYADKLFIPFQRLHRTDEFPGTGIGLSIVLRIIERHGGKIWAESEIGKGATFFFTLPV
jgi:signal transduction histidine kinase